MLRLFSIQPAFKKHANADKKKLSATIVTNRTSVLYWQTLTAGLEDFLYLANIDLIDSTLVQESIELARTHSSPCLFNHVMRSWLFAVCIDQRTALRADPELLALATILHDLGLTTSFAGQDRFEVDGANAARTFLKARGLKQQKMQLVWDAIALHTTRSIALYKEPEVAMCHSGIAVDVVGLGFDLVEPKILSDILAAYPRLSMKKQFEECLCQIVREKPETTYDNFLNDMGARYVPGYAAPSFADYLRQAPFAE